MQAEEELNASPYHRKRNTKHVLNDDLKPVIQDLLHSIQGLYDTRKEDSLEDMKDRLDLLTAKYTNLAEICDFALPRKTSPKRTILRMRENMTKKATTTMIRVWKRMMQAVLSALVVLPVERRKREVR